MSNRLQIVMTGDDFRLLAQNAMRWAGYGWEPKIATGRFITSAGKSPATHWRMAYWFGDNYAAVILARSFLDDRRFRYETASDEDPGGGWMILTDYDMEANHL